MKNINKLTNKEAEQILEYVYPGETSLNNPKNYKIWFKELIFEPQKQDDGSYPITWSAQPVVGIVYQNNHGDMCILHFENTKVMCWLYKNYYDIKSQLEENQYLSEFENDMDNLSFKLLSWSKGEESFADGYKQNCTIEYYMKECKEMLEKYFY